jgi:hypothetical protein
LVAEIASETDVTVTELGLCVASAVDAEILALRVKTIFLRRW